MSPFSRRWRAAEQEHAESIAALLVAASYVPDLKWTSPLAADRWSPAETLQHVEQTYLLGREALRGGAGMALRRPRWVAWVSRRVLLPWMALTKRFPRNAPAPREVRPDTARAHGTPREQLIAELQQAAKETVSALRAVAERRDVHVVHAYLGALTPYETLRILSAHTRHHARLLAPPKIRGKSQPCVPDLPEVAA